MPLTPGSRLGAYEVVAAIGAGAMGEVYRARDTRLDREVAVKVLPENFASDPDRRARFEREAKAVAGLTHPNIVSLFDTGEQVEPGGGPVRFVVMELLNGETLRERLDASGTLPIRKAVEIAIQMARGLSAAHEKQLVHRDLKPENVFLTRDGQVKILDFGIAKGMFRESSDAAATETVAASTDPGTAIGTAGYMAPEQVRGHAVDARTDLFALGAVLYEMLCGKRAFRGDTHAETMTAILREEPPDLLMTRADAGPALERIVRHCLEKNPEERFQSARDVAFALEALSGSGTSASARVDENAPRQNRTTLRVAIGAATGLALLALGFFGARVWSPSVASAQWTGAALGGPVFAQTPKVSPDGRTLAFIAMVGTNTEVAVMTPESGDWAVRTGHRKAGYVTDLSWSPDGGTIYYGLNSAVPMGVFSIPSVGGAEKLVLEDAAAPVALADGSLLVARLDASRQQRLYQFWPDNGRLKEWPITLPNFSQATRAFPDGKSAVVLGKHTAADAAAGFHLYLLDLASGAISRLASDKDELGVGHSIAVAPDGQSVIVPIVAGQLTRVVRFSRDGRVAPATLFTMTKEIWGLDVGPDGSIYADQIDQDFIAAEFATTGGRGETLGSIDGTGLACCATAAVLPDGRIIVPGMSGGYPRLMVMARGTDPRPLITSEESTAPVTIAGDGQIAFLAGPPTDRRIAFASTANGRISQRIEFRKGDVASLSASPDGQTLYVGAGGTIWAQPVSGGEPRAIRSGSSAAITPDGLRLVVQALEVPKNRLFEVTLSTGAEREIALTGPYQLTFDALNSASVGRNGRLAVPLALIDNWYFRPGLVDLATGQMTVIPTDYFADFHFLLWTPGEQRIIGGGYPTRYSLWRFRPDKR